MDNMPFPAAFIDDIPQVCVLCGIYFSNSLSLQYHMRLHAGPQEPTLFDARPPPALPNPVPTTTASPTNGSHNSSSNISPVTPNSTMPKQDFELGLEFLNSLTQMYANPSASRESKEKGYDFRYEPNTSSQPPLGTTDTGKPSESLKYNFDDFYNSPGAEALDKKFESVLNYELSKDNGMHFGNHKEPLESILDEPLLDNEKEDKLVDTVSQMYQNELRNELDNISNDSVKSDTQSKFTNIKVTDLVHSPKQNNEKTEVEISVKDKSLPQAYQEKTVSQDVSQTQTSVSNISQVQANDSPSFEYEIPKVGKLMKIKKYFESQEMRKKERNSVEKSDSLANILQNGEKSDKSKEVVTTIASTVNKNIESTVSEKTKKSFSASETNLREEKSKNEKSSTTNDKKEETAKEEEIGINLRSLRRRPNRVEEQKKQTVKKKAPPKRCTKKDQVDEKLKELEKETIGSAICTEAQKEELGKEQNQEISTIAEGTKHESKEKEETQNSNCEQLDIKETSTESAIEINEEKITHKEENADTLTNVTSTEEKTDTEPQQLTQESTMESQKDPVVAVYEQEHIIEDAISDPEMTESEISDDAGCMYGQETVEPLKIKIWKIKRHKKKKHKKKKRKKERKDRSSTESLSLTDYMAMTDLASAEIGKTKHEHKKSKRFFEKKHACEVCGQSFGQRCDLRKHIMIHTGERPWVCEICEKTFQRKTDLSKHTRIHTGEKPYECEYCGKKVSDKSQLNVHRRLHTGDRPYQCDVCSKGCITSSELTRHRQSHFAEKPWKCEVCQKAFKLKECLAMHMKIHNGTHKHQCAKCGLGFDRESKLEHHMQLHEVDNPYMCRECGMEFNNQSHYANHIKSHKKELRGPFSCDYCGKLYEYKSFLDSHVRTHTGEKPFICELCNNSYSLKGNLKHHMKVQHGDSLHKCEICSETFHLKRDLINHSRAHPEDQLNCYYCDSHFWDPEAADNHREQCSARKSYDVENTDNPEIASILNSVDEEFAKSYTPQGKIESPPPTRNKKELDKIYEFDDSDSETKTKRAKARPSSRRELHSHMSPRSRDLRLSPRNKDIHMSPRSRDHFTHLSPKGAKRSRDPEIPKPLTISAILNSPPMNKRQKPVPQSKSEKADLFQGVIDKSAVLSNKDDDLDLLHPQIDANVSDTLPNLSVSDKTDLFENIIDGAADLGQSKESAPVPFTGSLSSTTESSVFSSKDTIDSLLSSAPVISEEPTNLPEQHSNLPVTSDNDSISAARTFAPSYNWKHDLMPSMDYVNSLLMKSLNGPSAMTSAASCNKYDADDSLSKFNLDYLNPLIMKTLNPDLKFDTNENLQKTTSFYTTSTQSASVFSPTSTPSSSVFSPPPGTSYSYKPQFSSPSDTRVDTFTTSADYSSSLSNTLRMPNIEKLAMDYLYQSSVANEKQDFQQKFGLTGKTDASVPLPSFNYLNTMASNQDALTDALDMSAFSGLPSMSAFTRNTEFNAHLGAPSSYGALDISKTLPSGEKLDDPAALLSNFEYGS